MYVKCTCIDACKLNSLKRSNCHRERFGTLTGKRSKRKLSKSFTVVIRPSSTRLKKPHFHVSLSHRLSTTVSLGGVYMSKLAPARVSHWDDFLISYRVYMMTGSFHILLFNGTFHVDKIHVWFKIANITHALPVPIYRQTDFTPKWLVVSCFILYCDNRCWPPHWQAGLSGVFL